MNFITKFPINKGWSSDKKYCVTDENGTRYLLRDFGYCVIRHRNSLNST